MPKKTFIFLILIMSFGLLIFNFFQTEEAKASSADNVWGWAWGGYPEVEGGVLKAGSGWISFNCYNEYDGGPLEDRCPPSNYGVHICESDTDPLCGAVSAPKTGKFVGYAWMGGGQDAASNPTSTLGWVKFGEPLKIGAESYPVCPLSTCPAGSPNYTARFDTVTQRVTGWARACAGTVNGDCISATRTDGWDGWILLGPIVKGAIDYGVSITTTTDPDEFEGWAWGSDVVGWISFNTDNYAGGSDYKVMTNFSFSSPTATPTAAMSCDGSGCPGGICNVGSWESYQPLGDPPCIYTINNDSTDPDSSNCSPGPCNDDIVQSEWFLKPFGAPDTDYVSKGSCPGVCNYTLQSDVQPGDYTIKLYVEDADGNSDEETHNLTVRPEASADFMCSLNNIDWEECDDPAIFGAVNVGDPIYLADDNSLPRHSVASAGAINSRDWALNEISFDSGNSTNTSTTLVGGSNVIKLTIVDTASRSASQEYDIGARFPLPEYREVAPIGRLDNFLARLTSIFR